MSKTISFWRIVIQLSWAKSLTWGVTTEESTRTFWLSIHTVVYSNNKILNIIIGPISVIFGFV